MSWSKNQNIMNYLILMGVYLFSLAFFHGQEFLSGFDLFRGDMGDAALIAVYREHAYRVLLNFLGLERYFSSSLLHTPWAFFPHSNIYFYADTIFADLPVYALFRAFGMNPMASQSMVMIFSSSVMYFLSFYIGYRELRFKFIPCVIAGFLIAFNMPRAIMLMHPQMISGYWTILSIYFLIRYLKTIAEPTNSKKIHASLFFSVLSFCAQIWVSFYLGFFEAMALLSLGLVFLFKSPLRGFKNRVYWVGRHFILRPELYVPLVLTLLPLAYFHLQALKEVGGRSVAEISSGLPQITSYFAVSPASWYFHFMHWVWHYVPAGRAPEWHMFAGFIPIFFVLASFYFLARYPRNENQSRQESFSFLFFKFCLLVFCVLFVVTFSSRTGYSLWNVFGPIIPGSSAIRAMCRIALFLIIPAAFMGAFLLGKVFSSKAWLNYIFSILILSGVIRENFMLQDYLNSTRCMESRLSTLEEKFREHCSEKPIRSFLLRWKQTPSWVEQESLAQWLSMRIQVPTLNGYSGNNPPNYELGSWNYERLHKAGACEGCVEWFYERKHLEGVDTICLLMVDQEILCEKTQIPKKWFDGF